MTGAAHQIGGGSPALSTELRRRHARHAPALAHVQDMGCQGSGQARDERPCGACDRVPPQGMPSARHGTGGAAQPHALPGAGGDAARPKQRVAVTQTPRGVHRARGRGRHRRRSAAPHQTTVRRRRRPATAARSRANRRRRSAGPRFGGTPTAVAQAIGRRLQRPLRRDAS